MTTPEKNVYTLPYKSQLQEKIEPGQTLIIRGSSIEESARFTISLHCKTPDFSGNDIPLHMSIRFDEGKIVLNTFEKNDWGKEERKSNPIKKGGPFDIRIRAHDTKFQIIIDQKEFKEFEYRLPLGNITHFAVDGDIYLNYIQWGGKYYPVPYESGFANGLPVGKKLIIHATPEKKAKRFLINLLHKNGDIAFHFNPRLDDKVVVRNSLLAGDWGNEEREGKIPFERGVGFDLVISNEPTCFNVTVNDVHFCNFAHRSDPHDIAGLQIDGEVELTGIQLH